MAEFVDDRTQRITRECGQALLVGLPDAENAVEFFVGVRSPEMRAIAPAAIEQTQGDGEAGLRPRAEVGVEPIEVDFLLHERLHPRHHSLVEGTVLLDELLEGAVFDKLPRRRQKIDW